MTADGPLQWEWRSVRADIPAGGRTRSCRRLDYGRATDFAREQGLNTGAEVQSLVREVGMAERARVMQTRRVVTADVRSSAGRRLPSQDSDPEPVRKTIQSEKSALPC